ncbi:MAG: hypothetical protein H7246_17815 [Phycisphaerae bacterium]|nr:hypothetical protein [Saprospiraceae bacterium]
MRIFLAVLLIPVFPVLAGSQALADLKFERISAGLSNLAAGRILQDRQGFLWFCTEEGLNRYDGYTFKVFKKVSGDSTSLNTDIISNLYETRDGKIWACTYRGFSVFDPLREQFTHFELLDHQAGTCVYEDLSGQLWLGTTTHFYQHDRTTGKTQKINVPGLLHATAIAGGKNGLLWISTFNGFFRYDPRTGQSRHYLIPTSPHLPAPTQIVTINAQDDKGRLWLGTWNAGLHLFDPDRESFQSYFDTGKEGFSLNGNITLGVAIAADGKVWVATGAGGLAILNPETGFISIHKHSPDDEFSIPGYYTSDVYHDRQGITWVSTTRGIAKLTTQALFFETCKLKSPWNNVVNSEFWALHVDHDAEIWAGNFSGIYRIDRHNGQMENLTERITGSTRRGCYPILEDEKGTIWVFSDGIFFRVKNVRTGIRTPPSRKKSALHFTVEKLPLTPFSPRAWEIIPIGKNEFWIAGTDGGIYRFDKITGITTRFMPDSVRHRIKPTSVNCLEALPDGSFLAGIRDAGLVRFDPADGSFRKIEMNLPNQYTPAVLTAIFTDSKGRIWIGTSMDGLIRTDSGLGSFRQYTDKDGLPSSCLYQILEDNNGQLWIRSRGGLILFNPENETFINFGTGEGLRNPNLLGEMCRDRTGRFYMGDLGYLQIFNPANAITTTHEFPVYITVMKEGVNPLTPTDWNKDLRFLYHQNYISFEFVALNYAETGSTTYAYYLEGLNRQWQAVGEKRFITFAGLQPGNYRFRVRAAGKDGIWRDCEQAISFKISGPFWRAWWFLAACAFALGGLIFYFYKLKINRLRAEIAIRNSIAQDLHDDVGSTLSGVNVFSTLALQKLKAQPEAAAALLAQISQKTTAMSDAMSDIVWSINPKNDSVQDLIVRMKEYAAEMLESRDIRYKFSIDKKLLAQKLPLGLRKDLYLIFKEAINNLSKYSECQTAKIAIVLTQKQLVMVVADDGKGFDETTVRAGNGLANLRARAAKLGGQMEIISKIGVGTTMRCTLPIP